MVYAERMLETAPRQPRFDRADLAECIKACFDCAQACTACADACLGEQDVTPFLRCIRLNLDCADICITTGKMLSRQTEFDPAMVLGVLESCAAACKLCGDECAMHAERGLAHCGVCAEACVRCEAACNKLLSQIAA